MDEIEFKAVDANKAADDAEESKQIAEDMHNLQTIVLQVQDAVTEDSKKINKIEDKVVDTKSSVARAQQVIKQAEAQQRAARMKNVMIFTAVALIIIILIIILVMKFK